MAFQTICELVDHSIRDFGDAVAFEMLNDEAVTYVEAGRRIERIREQLVGAGLRKGDKVVLLSSSMPNWGICYLAIASSGFVVVPVLPDFTGDELAMIIRHSEAKALYVSDKLFTKLPKECVAELNLVVRTKNLKPIALRPAQQPGLAETPQPDDLAAIIYTSGTTSSPKGVMLQHRALCKHIDLCYGAFPIDRSDVFLSVLPLSHTYECSIGMIYPFALGVRVVYLDRPPTASALLPALKKVRPTVMLIVPLIIEKIYRSQVLAKFNSNAFWRALYGTGFTRRYLHRIAGSKLRKVFGGRLRFLGIGGAKLDAAVERFMSEGHVPYAIGYGLTETAPLLAAAPPHMVRIGSTGPHAVDVQLRLDDINPETHQGEVVALSPCVMMGYYKNPEATAEAFTEDGWFRTGDLGEFSEDGWLYLKGRLKNMIVGPSGENIYPEEIESVLNSHVCITDSIVTEREGHLVALVHFDTEALEAKLDSMRGEWEARKGEWSKEWENRKEEWNRNWKRRKGEWERRKEELKKEILEYANSKLNRFSRISEVVEEKQEFIKTPTQKIKRFLYNEGNQDALREAQLKRDADENDTADESNATADAASKAAGTGSGTAGSQPSPQDMPNVKE